MFLSRGEKYNWAFVLLCVTLCYSVYLCVFLCFFLIHCVTFCFSVFLCVSLWYIVLLFVTLFLCVSLWYIALLSVTLFFSFYDLTWHCVTLCYFAFRCVTLRYFALTLWVLWSAGDPAARLQGGPGASGGPLPSRRHPAGLHLPHRALYLPQLPGGPDPQDQDPPTQSGRQGWGGGRRRRRRRRRWRSSLVFLSTCLSRFFRSLADYLSVCLPACLYTLYLSVCLPICLSSCLSPCLSQTAVCLEFRCRLCWRETGSFTQERQFLLSLER